MTSPGGDRVQIHAADPAVSATPAKVEEKPAVGNQRPDERKVKAWIGLGALAGIVITGVGLAALIIMWAGRLRRQIRQPMPACEVAERDFWFLKPPKPTVKDSSLPDSHLPPHEAPDT